MFIRGLRTKIALNLAILFLVAMLLINIVAMMTAKRDIIRKEVSRGHFLVSTLMADLLGIENQSEDEPGKLQAARVLGFNQESEQGEATTWVMHQELRDAVRSTL